MKYKLLRDCPHGKAGSIWVYLDRGTVDATLEKFGQTLRYSFPIDTLSHWFEEIKEMKKFTKEQAIELEKHAHSISFKSWLDEHTEA